MGCAYLNRLLLDDDLELALVCFEPLIPEQLECDEDPGFEPPEVLEILEFQTGMKNYKACMSRDLQILDSTHSWQYDR